MNYPSLGCYQRKLCGLWVIFHCIYHSTLPMIQLLPDSWHSHTASIGKNSLLTIQTLVDNNYVNIFHSKDDGVTVHDFKVIKSNRQRQWPIWCVYQSSLQSGAVTSKISIITPQNNTLHATCNHHLISQQKPPWFLKNGNMATLPYFLESWLPLLQKNYLIMWNP